MIKICKKCGTPKNNSDYRERHNACRDCEKENVINWRKENPEKYNATQKKYMINWRAKNPEKSKEISRRSMRKTINSENLMKIIGSIAIKNDKNGGTD